MTMPSDEGALLEDDPLWFKDAVIYQLHVKAFRDSGGDGIGDFSGLHEKLDYLQSLGVTAIWLLPFYPSPLRDDGYDISGYTDIHPAYGNLRDFKAFLRAAHRRGIRVITELVINHTRRRASSSRISRRPTGPGTIRPGPTTGTASTAISRTSTTTIPRCTRPSSGCSTSG